MKKLSFLVLAITVIFGAVACTDAKTEIKNTTPEENQTQKDDNESQVKEHKVTFYYADESVMYLVPQECSVFAKDDEFFNRILSTLLQGPQNGSLVPTVKGNVKLLSASVKDGVCTVDLSSEFNDNSGGSTKEMMAVYSLVSTFCSVDSIDSVKININGDENPSFGSFDLSEPLEPNLDLFQK